MHIGKVIGTIVATSKNEKLIGSKLMIVQPIDSKLQDKGGEVVAVDTVGAGIGEIIIYASGTAARIGANKRESPIDLAIIGIVDTIDLKEK